MSETAFREAKGQLAHSQGLIDELRQSQMPQEAPMQDQNPTPEPDTQQPPQEAQPVAEAPIETKGEAGILSSFMDEVRALFKGKEDEEKKTQELITKHEKEVTEIKDGLSQLLNEEDK